MSRQSSGLLGNELRERREVLSLSRLGLAYKAGVDPRTIERIESGQVSPRRATLAVIEGVLSKAEAELAEAA